MSPHPISDHLVAGELHNDFSISLEEFVDGTYNYFVFMKNKNNIVSVHLSHRSVCMQRDMQTIFDRNRTIIGRSKTIISKCFAPIPTYRLVSKSVSRLKH